jgi:glycosyltransferase involved in cell wall biosynthesis
MSGHRATICQLLINLELGGAEILAARLARRLDGGYRFIFICLETLGQLGEELRRDGFTVHVLNKDPGIDLKVAPRLRSLIRQEGIDLIHAHHWGPFFYAAMARVPSRSPAVLLTEHGRQHPDPPRRSHFVANRLLLGRHDRLLAVGQRVRQALIDKEGFPSHRVEVIYNGIDTVAFADAERCRGTVREELGIGEGEFVILQVARLHALKDHATAIRAIGRVVNRLRDVRLILAGEGPQASEIGCLIDRLGLRAHVQLLGHCSEVKRVLAAADLALLSSVSEGIPLSLIEGMAAGLPVLATRVGGIPEVVEEGRTGMLVSAGDDEAMAQQILRLADDGACRERMGQAGRERASELFSETRMVAQYDRLYRDMTIRRAVGRASCI